MYANLLILLIISSSLACRIDIGDIELCYRNGTGCEDYNVERLKKYMHTERGLSSCSIFKGYNEIQCRGCDHTISSRMSCIKKILPIFCYRSTYDLGCADSCTNSYEYNEEDCVSAVRKFKECLTPCFNESALNAEQFISVNMNKGWCIPVKYVPLEIPIRLVYVPPKKIDIFV
jgi:hypothetical protein